MSQVTELLRDWSAGRQEARDELLRLVYDPLRAIAERHLYREREGHTLQPTALVHELYLRLVDQRSVEWNGRMHFFAVAAQVMRRILVDHARRELRDKRGGGEVAVALDDRIATPQPSVDTIDVLALDTALAKLAALDPEQSRLVELRFFGGLTNEETAAALGVSVTTVKREWALAKGWLHRELTGRA